MTNTNNNFDVKAIENELKDWFLTRFLLKERTRCIKELLEKHHVIGIHSPIPSFVSVREKCMWNDLIHGKPDVEDTLTLNAKNMKIDLYSSMLKDSTDYTHPCRKPGMLYLQCVKNNIETTLLERERLCSNVFNDFKLCRIKLIEEESHKLNESLKNQIEYDNRAMELWIKYRKLVSNNISDLGGK